MTASDLIGAGLVGGAAWIYWRSRQAQAPGPHLVPVSYAPAPARGPNLGAALSGLFNILGGAGSAQASGSALTSPAGPPPAQASGSGAPLGNLFNLFGSFGGQGSGNAGGTMSGSLAPLLNTIASGEANNGYDSVYLGSPVQPAVPISQMTVSQVLAFQSHMIAAGSRSSAVGRYQFLHATLQGLVNDGTLSPGEVFGPAAQDRAATALMDRRGLGAYRSGRISASQFAHNLSQEWASLPRVTGSNPAASYYAGTNGNAARVSVSSIMGAIQGVA